jgi:hypothetical protein
VLNCGPREGITFGGIRRLSSLSECEDDRFLSEKYENAVARARPIRPEA